MSREADGDPGIAEASPAEVPSAGLERADP